MPPRQQLFLTFLIPLTAVAIVLLVGLSAQPSAQASDDLRIISSFYRSAASARWLALVALAPLFVVLELPKFEPALRSLDDPGLREAPLTSIG